jgi:hypothetical protein
VSKENGGRSSLDGTHRMNVPGTLGAHSGSWRFEWPWIGTVDVRGVRGGFWPGVVPAAPWPDPVFASGFEPATP